MHFSRKQETTRLKAQELSNGSGGSTRPASLGNGNPSMQWRTLGFPSKAPPQRTLSGRVNKNSHTGNGGQNIAAKIGKADATKRASDGHCHPAVNQPPANDQRHQEGSLFGPVGSLKALPGFQINVNRIEGQKLEAPHSGSETASPGCQRS